MKPMRRIAVLRALHLGDMLCAVPALRALRAAQPRARITLIGLPWAQAFVERFHAYVDELMVLPALPGMPEQQPGPDAPRRIQEFIEEACWRRFDLAIQFHGNGNLTNDLLLQFGATRAAGFHAAGRACPDKARFLLWQEVEHEVLRGLRLMQALGVPVDAGPQGNALEFPLSAVDFDALQRASDRLPLSGSFACIHPGARMPSRRWPAERFAEVADRLAQQGLRIVLTGSEEEGALVDTVEQAMRMPALNLAGKTDLGAFAVLVSQARLVVCNDTGTSHVAAAVGTPSVVICCGADPLRWAPLDRMRHRVLAHTIFCRPCMHAHCPIGHPCALNIGVDMVMEQAGELLELDVSTATAERRRQPESDSAQRSLAT